MKKFVSRLLVAVFLAISVVPAGVGVSVVASRSAEAGIFPKTPFGWVAAGLIGKGVAFYVKKNGVGIAKKGLDGIISYLKKHPEHFVKARDVMLQQKSKFPRASKLIDDAVNIVTTEIRDMLFDAYLDDIYKCIGMPVPKAQLAGLKKSIRKNSLRKLGGSEIIPDGVATKQEILIEFGKKDFRPRKIAEWEKNTGMKWPENPAGLSGRNPAGNLQQMHHIIPKERGGSNDWSNFIPATGGKASSGGNHQSCIHIKDSGLDRLVTYLGVK